MYRRAVEMGGVTEKVQRTPVCVCAVSVHVSDTRQHAVHCNFIVLGNVEAVKRRNGGVWRQSGDVMCENVVLFGRRLCFLLPQPSGSATQYLAVALNWKFYSRTHAHAHACTQIHTRWSSRNIAVPQQSSC